MQNFPVEKVEYSILLLIHVYDMCIYWTYIYTVWVYVYYINCMYTTYYIQNMLYTLSIQSHNYLKAFNFFTLLESDLIIFLGYYLSLHFISLLYLILLYLFPAINQFQPVFHNFLSLLQSVCCHLPINSLSESIIINFLYF